MQCQFHFDGTMTNAMTMITEKVWRFSYLTPGSCFGAEICSMVTPLERLLLFCWLSSLARNPVLRFFFSAVIVTPVAEGAPTMATAAAEVDDDDIVLLSAVVDSTRKDFS